MTEDNENVTIHATCLTAGCENYGIPIPLLVPEPDITVLCGVCSNEITDVKDGAPELPKDVPSWLS